MRKPERTYDVCVVVFKEDFEPEPGTYDMIIRKKGLKYKLIPQVCDMIKWENYDYIGTWDDDYCTDIQSVNRSLELARRHDFRLFQQAVTSFNTFPCLRHNPEWIFFSETTYSRSFFSSFVIMITKFLNGVLTKCYVTCYNVQHMLSTTQQSSICVMRVGIARKMVSKRWTI
jgi:hypothetical protein